MLDVIIKKLQKILEFFVLLMFIALDFENICFFCFKMFVC